MAFLNSEILDRIAAGLGNRTDKSRTTDLVPWVDLALGRIARAHPWEELETTTVISVSPTGTPAIDKIYAVPINIRDLHSIILYEDAEPRNARKLVHVPVRAWDKMIPAGEEYSTGTPTHYTYRNKQFEWYRVPDKDYTFKYHYTYWPSSFKDVNLVQVELENKDDLIIYLALSYGFHELNMTEEGNRNYGIYRTMLKDAIAEDLSNRDTTIVPRGIQEGHIGNPLDPWTDPFQRG